MDFLSKIVVAAALTACCILVPAPASAIGTMNIHRIGVGPHAYNDIEIKVFSGSLFLTSDDGAGTLVVTRAACSYQGKIMVCFPKSAALVQHGESNALDLKSGTIYFNDTDDAQTMMFSSQKVPADSVMLAITLRDGTFIDARGRIDEVIRE